MYALINKMSAVPGDSIGRVLFLHRSVEAAEEADHTLQGVTRKGSGSASYIPTRIVKTVGKVSKGALIGNESWTSIDG